MRYTVKREDGLFLETLSRDSALAFAREGERREIRFKWVEQSPRFAIRKLKTPSARPWILADRTRPAYRFPTTSHARAVFAMRNVIRREHGLAPLIEWPSA